MTRLGGNCSAPGTDCTRCRASEIRSRVICTQLASDWIAFVAALVRSASVLSRCISIRTKPAAGGRLIHHSGRGANLGSSVVRRVSSTRRITSHAQHRSCLPLQSDAPMPPPHRTSSTRPRDTTVQQHRRVLALERTKPCLTHQTVHAPSRCDAWPRPLHPRRRAAFRPGQLPSAHGQATATNCPPAAMVGFAFARPSTASVATTCAPAFGSTCTNATNAAMQRVANFCVSFKCNSRLSVLACCHDPRAERMASASDVSLSATAPIFRQRMTPVRSTRKVSGTPTVRNVAENCLVGSSQTS